MTLQQLALFEESLFLNYKSKGLTDTQIALQIAIDKITARISKAGDEITRKQQTELLKLIKEELKKSYAGLFEAMQEESIQAAEIVGAYMAVETKKIPIKVMNDIIDSKRNIFGYEFKELFQIREAEHIQALKVVIASGVGRGLPANEIVKNLIHKNDFMTNSRLTTAVNTTIKESREMMRYEKYREYEKDGLVKGYEFDATLDGGTSEQCRERSGRKYMVKFDEIPLSDRPGLHPNCRSILVIISTNEFTEGKKASMFGQTKDESYPKWLAGLDDDKQKIVLGKKFQAYKEGRYKINSLADIKGVASHSIKDIDKFMNDKSNF